VPNTTTTTLFNNIRAKLPGIVDGVIKLAVFDTCDELSRDALNTVPATDSTADESTFLATLVWPTAYQPVMDGTLARLYSQPAKSWTNLELAKAHQDRYMVLLNLLRADTLSVVASTVYTRLLNTIQGKLPMVRQQAIIAELYNTADQIRREALNLTALTDADDLPTEWLSVAQYQECYQALQAGVLYRLYSQTGKPWSDPEMAKAQYTVYRQEMFLLRGDNLGKIGATVYDRLINAIRTQVPDARAQMVVAEVYNTVDKIRREALNLTPLTDAEDLPAEWLTVGQYSTCYQAILSGALYRLLGQVGKPWSNAELAKANFDIYQQELTIIRTGTATPTATGFARILDATRQHLPGVSDNILKQELFNVIDEFLSRTNVSQQKINFSTVVNQKTYTITPSGNTTFVRLLYVTDAAEMVVAATMATIGSVVLQTAPSTVATLTACVSVSCNSVDGSGYPIDVPAAVLDRYYDAFSCGLLARMMLHPSKQYTNVKLATYHGKRFDDVMNACRQEVRQQNLMGGQAWRFPQSFSTSRGQFR